MIPSKSSITCVLLVTIISRLSPYINAQQCYSQCNNGSGWNSQLTVVSLNNNGTILLSWQYNTIDDQYTVMHRLTDSVNYTISYPMNSTSHTLTGLLGESIYEFKVCLVNDPLNCGNCQKCYTTSTFLPSKIEQSGASVFRGERGSSDLVVLLTWAGLTIEQAGGVLTSYMISLYTISQSTTTLLRNITVDPDEVLLELTDLMADQMYSFTVRAVNRAGDGPESEEVIFNTNGPQPPMELLATDSEGVAGIIRNNQSNVEEADFSTPFGIDSRNLIIYHIESDQVFGTPFNNPQNTWVLANLSQGMDDVMSVAYDWITRVLYFATSDEFQTLTILSLPLDNPLFQSIDTGIDLSNDSNVFMTIAPFTGYLYWIEVSPSVTLLYQLNLLNGSLTQLYQSNSLKRNLMCPQSSGLDTIGQLTPALTYDAVTDRLWVSSVAGDIWSCDLSGCDCHIEVEGEAILNATNVTDVLSDISLPTDSISLDSVDIYWSGPAGVFSVPRSDVTMLSQLSSLNVSSIVTIDPGQQPLPEEMCLFLAVNMTEQPQGECINATNSTLQLRWFAPNITDQCSDQLTAFPTINYTVSYHAVSTPNQIMEVVTFDEMITLTNLKSYTQYVIQIQAGNIYTPSGSGDLHQLFCTTQPTVLPGPVVDVNILPQSTSLNVTWSPPLFSSSEAGGNAYRNLMYMIELQEASSVLDDERIVHTTDNHAYFTGLQPATTYTVTIAPIILGAVFDPVVYFTQTLDNVTDAVNVIMATDMGIVTKPIIDHSLTFINNLDTTEVAYDSQRDTFYWAVKGNPIQLQQLSAGSLSNLVNVTSAAGIAVDYIGQRLYWIEGGTSLIYLLLDDDNISLPVLVDEGVTDLAVDSPNGLLFWSHNGATQGISVWRLNGVGGRLMCVADNNQLYRYHAITVDTENKRIFWIKEVEGSEMAGSFQIGMAEYDDGSCTNHINKMISSELSGERISMTYVAGLLLYTSSVLPNTIFVAPSNFSSFSSADYQLAVGSYSISTDDGDVNIRSITANQTSQQFLPNNVELNVTTVRPSVPVNISLDESSTPTFINITWDMVEGVSPAIVTYEVTYSLSRLDRSTENSTLQTNNNYFVLEDQSPETTVNVSVTAYTRWYSSEASPVEMILSDSRIPSQIEWSAASVFRGERRSNDLSVLLTWAGLTIEQAGGVLTSYMVSLYTIDQSTRTSLRNVTVDPDEVLLEPTDLMTDQMYSFTVRAVNRAGDGPESEEVTFSTNGPQPPMELLVTDIRGMVGIIKRNQSTVEETGFFAPFAVNNSNSTVYYVQSGKVFAMPLRNPEFVRELAGMSQSHGDILEMTYDWITRVLYLSVSTVMVESTNNSRFLTIWSLPVDNPVFRMIHRGNVLSDDTKIVMTIAPRIGHLYWTEAGPLGTAINQLNLVNESFTQLYQSNPLKRSIPTNDSSGLDTIGQLTPAVTYDMVTDRLWVSSVAGDIWSCDLTGCDCHIEVEGEAVLNATNVTDALSDISLPTDSISLDSVNIYWSGPAGVFSVPRNDVTMLSQFAAVSNISSVVTIDPGQQQLPRRECLFPVTDFNGHSQAQCINSTNSTAFVRWDAPNVTDDCRDELVAFPTLLYTIHYSQDTMGNNFPPENVETTFDLIAEITGLASNDVYAIVVIGDNLFTERARALPDLSFCTTAPNVVSNLTVTAHSTRLLYVAWERPVTPPTEDKNEPSLTYNVLVNGTYYNSTADDTTSISIPGLIPNTLYHIEVFANNSEAIGESVEVVQATWPIPPTPEVVVVTSTTLGIHVPLGEIYEPIAHLYLIFKERNRNIVEKNETVVLEGLQSYNKTVEELTPNTEYVIQSHAIYRMTDYNSNEDLMLYSPAIIQRTEVGVPDAPVIRLNGSVIMWTPPNNNGRNITSYNVTVTSSDGTYTTTLPNETTSFDLRTLQFPNGLRSNVTLQAVNVVGASEHSNSEPYNTSLVTADSSSSDIFTGGVMAGIIIACIIAGIFLLVLTMVMCSCCCRNKAKTADLYDFRIDLPYNNELRVLRMSQMRMANNDLYMCDYSEGDLEALKQIPKDSITLEKELGRGAFGEVWEGNVKDIMGPGTGGHRVAIKMLQKNAAEMDKRSFLSEALIMSNFNHPNVLPVLGVCLSNPFYLILELMEAGDLLAFLRGARQENGPPLLTIEELVKIALDVANGARYLESQHFVHRDLAARNCLVSSKGPDRVVKIGDFGLARDVYHSDYYRKEGQGLLPVRWMAPESLLDGKFTVDSDIWSYGILLWEITTLGRQPYPARSNQEVFQFVIGGGRCDKPDNCHPKLYWLMKSCWAHRPEDRPRFRSIVDVLSRQYERLNRHDSECSDAYDESEEEDSLTPGTTMTSRQRPTVNSNRSFRSSIRSGASFIASGIATLTRSSRLMNSIRNRASLHRSVPNGNSYQSSVENLIESKDQNGFREIGPF